MLGIAGNTLRCYFTKLSNLSECFSVPDSPKSKSVGATTFAVVGAEWATGATFVRGPLVSVDAQLRFGKTEVTFVADMAEVDRQIAQSLESLNAQIRALKPMFPSSEMHGIERIASGWLEKLNTDPNLKFNAQRNLGCSEEIVSALETTAVGIPASERVLSDLRQDLDELRALVRQQARRIDALEAAARKQVTAPEHERLAEDEVSRAPLRKVQLDAMLAPFAMSEEEAERSLAEDPEMLDGDAFGARIGVTRQAVQQKRARGEILGLQQGGRKIWYPTVQIDGQGRILAGIADVLAAFDGDAWAAWEFLTSVQVGLDGLTGREALLAGRKADALTTIEGIREGAFG